MRARISPLLPKKNLRIFFPPTRKEIPRIVGDLIAETERRYALFVFHYSYQGEFCTAFPLP